MSDLQDATKANNLVVGSVGGVTMAEALEAMGAFNRQFAEYQPEPKPLPAPMAIATWQPVTVWEYDQQTWMALDRRLYCIISTSPEPSPVGDRGTFIVTCPRPDGLFEHLYGPGPRVIEAMRALGEG